MRPCYFLSLLALGLVACDGGDGTSCLLDSDCADFSQVCIEGTCRLPGELPDGGSRDGSTGRDSGPRVDAGEPMDSGPGDDAGPPGEGGTPDASEGGMMGCEDVTGDWEISFVNSAACGDAMVGFGVTIGPGAMLCEFSATSVSTAALDGTLTLDAANMLLGMLATGTADPVLCNGNFSPAGQQFTFICGACVMNLIRTP